MQHLFLQKALQSHWHLLPVPAAEVLHRNPTSFIHSKGFRKQNFIGKGRWKFFKISRFYVYPNKQKMQAPSGSFPKGFSYRMLSKPLSTGPVNSKGSPSHTTHDPPQSVLGWETTSGSSSAGDSSHRFIAVFFKSFAKYFSEDNLQLCPSDTLHAVQQSSPSTKEFNKTYHFPSPSHSWLVLHSHPLHCTNNPGNTL